MAAIYFTVAMSLCLFIDAGNITLTIIICVLSGVGISASQIIPWSILPDIIEIDEYHNGTRREGAFYGLTTFIYKLASAVAIAGVGKVLSLFGYQEAAIDAPAGLIITQPDSALTAVKLIIGLAPGIFFIASAIFVYYLPITKESFEKILEELRLRKRKEV